MAIRDIIGIAILGGFLYFTLGYLFVKYVVPIATIEPSDTSLGVMFVFWPVFLVLWSAGFITAAIFAVIATIFDSLGRYLSYKVMD